VQLGLAGMALAYAAIAVAVLLASRLLRRRRLSSLRSGSGEGRPHRRLAISILAVATALALVWFSGHPRRTAAPPHPAGLRVTIFDVGQGDAILLQPPRAPAVLVDGGPPGDELVEKLGDAGVGELGAAIVTHEQSDHDGGLLEALGAMPIGALLYARLSRATLAEVHSAGIDTRRIAAGAGLRAGSLHLDVLWPPQEALGPSAAGEDPNRLALVILARWHRFSMLLSADAEGETIPLDPGPIDVLKVAHHGSDDAGLADLIERTSPRLAVISVGMDNPYGHPTPGTLATLARHGVAVRRTDRDGTLVIEATRGSMSVRLRG
jgi:competence protein ComEC